MDVPDLDAPTEVPSINASTAGLSAFPFQVSCGPAGAQSGDIARKADGRRRIDLGVRMPDRGDHVKGKINRLHSLIGYSANRGHKLAGTLCGHVRLPWTRAAFAAQRD
jgi:hypothetical protein